MDTAIKLGQQIELYGFESLDNGTMVILRKLIGNAVRVFTGKYQTFQKLSLTLQHSSPLSVSAELVTSEETRKATAEGTNLFFTLDNALKQL